MRVFLHAARQHPCAIAAGRVDVVFIRVGAGQGVFVSGAFLFCEAGVVILMRPHFDLAADQRAVFVKAARRVSVENGFLLAADRLRGGVRRFLFTADQRIDHVIAFVGMLVIAVDPADQFFGKLIAGRAVLMAFALLQPAGDLRVLRRAIGAVMVAFALFQAADEIAAFIPAGFGVPVAVAFLQAARKGFCHGQAAVVMPVAVRFLLTAGENLRLRPAGFGVLVQRTDQRAAPVGIAFFAVDVRAHRRIAGGRVAVLPDFGQRTPQTAFLIIAGGIVNMHDKIRIAARQRAFRIFAIGGVLVDFQRFRRAARLSHRGDNLRIAIVAVRMLRDLAVRLHCDGGQNQRIGRAEHHHCAQNQQQPLPAAVKTAAL